MDGVEAVEKAAALIPDVIVMDLAMPRLDGWEATRRIKAVARDEPGFPSSPSPGTRTPSPGAGPRRRVAPGT